MKRLFHVFAFLCLLGVPIGVKAQVDGTVTISVTNSPANITLDHAAWYVVVRENSAAPTAVFSITPTGSVAHNYAAGQQFVFVKKKCGGCVPFQVGETVGTIVATTSGPFSFTADESIGEPSLAAKNGTGGVTSYSGLTSDGTTLSYTGTGGATAASFSATGPCNTGTTGCLKLAQGTAPASLDGNTITEYAPTSVTAYGKVLPGAAATGVPHEVNVSNTMTESIGPVTPSDATGNTSGSGNFCLVTNCSMTTPNLGTPSAINLANATNLPCAARPALTGDTTASAGSCATTTSKINGGSFSGTNGNIVGFGASNVPADSGVPTSNVVIEYHANCNSGTLTASQVSGIENFGANLSAAMCGSYVSTSGVIPSRNCTLKNLHVLATAGGVNGSDGVVTVNVAGSSSGITCTLGTGTSCSDVTHTAAVTPTQKIAVQIATQASTTVSNPSFAMQCQ